MPDLFRSVLPWLALLLLATGQTATLRAAEDIPVTLLTDPDDSDKRPRLDGEWVAWTRDTQLIGSDGTVIALDRSVPMVHVLGTGFRPDVTTSASGAVARVAWLAFGADASVEVRSSAWDGAAWTTSTLASGIPWADHVRADGDMTVWVAPDPSGTLRVHAHDGAATTVVSTGGHAFRPELARLPSGDLAMVFDTYVGTPDTLRYRVELSQWSATGGWSPPVDLSQAPDSTEFNADITVAPDGRLWFAWESHRGSTFASILVARRERDGTLTFPNAHPPSADPNDLGLVDMKLFRATHDPVIVVDGTGRPWLFAGEKRNSLDGNTAYDKVLHYTTYEGGAWTTPGIMLTSDLAEEYIDVVVQSGELQFVYQFNSPILRNVEVASGFLPEGPDPGTLTLSAAAGPPLPEPPVSLLLPADRTVDVDGTTYELVFLDLHAHSRASPDGVGERDYTLFHSRDAAGIDGWASTDHDERAFQYYLDWEYELDRRFVDLFLTESFTTFIGFEWTSNNAFYAGETIGHRATFDSSRVYRNNDRIANELPEYYALMQQEDAIGVPHHLGKLGGATFLLYDAAVQPIAEISSVHGVFEDTLVGKYLENGVRFGVTAAGDTHDTRSGTFGLAGVWIDPAVAPRREAIKQALRDRRTFGVQRDGMLLDVRINGAFMGSSIRHQGPLLLQYEILGNPSSDTIHVNVSRNGDWEHPVYSRLFAPGEPVDDLTVLPGSVQNAFYMLRVTNGTGLLPDDTLAWSTPVWVDRAGPVEVDGIGGGPLEDGPQPPAPATSPPPRVAILPDVVTTTSGTTLSLELDCRGPIAPSEARRIALHLRRDGGSWSTLQDDDLLSTFEVRPRSDGFALARRTVRLPPGTWTLVFELTDDAGRFAVAEARYVVE